MIKKLLFVSLLLIISVNKIHSQGTAGKDFWVAFMAQDWACYYNNNYWNNDTAELFISSQFAAKVSITAPGQNYSKSVTLVPNQTTMVRLPREVVCRYSDSVTTNGVHIVGDTTINVYAVNRYWWSKGATVVIPSTSIVESPEYFITTQKDFYSWGWYCNGKQLQSPEFTIVGIADSSVIEVVPTGASSRNSPAGIPFQITLKKGETFQYMTTDNDLTGSVVRSKYLHSKYAVFAGNRQSYTNRISGGQSCYSSWDHVYEQMMPTVTWGKEYTALPFKNNVKGYTLKIVAAENNTRVDVNGSYLASLSQGEFVTYEVYSDTLVKVNSNNRISVAQLTLGGYTCKNHPSKQYIGDPAMMMLFPDQQFGQSATINTVTQTQWWWWNNNWWWQQNAPEHHINVMTRTADTAGFQINNKKVPYNLWKTAGNMNGYHYTQITVDSGSHYLRSNKGFLAYVYGYLWFEGYAFAAAANFKPIQNNFVIVNAQCVKDTVGFQAVTNDTFINYQWVLGDGSTATGTKIKHKYKDTGWYTVKMYCYHKITNAKDSVTKTLYVADTKIKSLFNKDTAICGPVNMVVISKGFNIDNEYRWNDGHPVYYRAVKNPGVYWLEVKERNGCVYRDTLNVTASTIPQANFTVSDEAFCLNRNLDVKFRNYSTFQGKDSISLFTWDFGDTVVHTFDTLVKHRFKRANMYPVLLRATTKYGCYHDTFMVVDVWPSPKANFLISRKDTCFNTNALEFKNVTKVDVNEHKRFKWFFSEGYVISNSNPAKARTYVDTGLYKIYLIYENTNGCIDTMVQTAKIVPNPKADFTYPNALFCSRDSVSFESKGSSPYLPLTYTWVWKDKTQSTGEKVKKAFDSVGYIPVTHFVKSPLGCRDSVVKTLFVNETPLVNFSCNKDTQCFVGHTFHFTNQTKFSGSLNYVWNLSDGSGGTDSNLFNKQFAKDSVYQVTLSTTTSVGCKASKTKQVYVGGYPKALFSVDKKQQCFRGHAFNLSNLSQIKKGSLLTHRWFFGNQDSAQTQHINQYKYQKADSFIVQLIVESNLGCKDTTQNMLVVHEQGKAAFENLVPNQCFKQQQFSFKNKSTNRFGLLSYQWNLGDNTLLNTVDVNHRYSQAGAYTVLLETTTANNCKDTATQTINVFASPNAGFTINQDKQCFRNNLFNFNNSSTLANGSISSYQWDLGDQTTAVSANVVNKKYVTEDTFRVRLIVSSNHSCNDTVQKQIVTWAEAKAAFSVNQAIQCVNQQNFKLTNQSQIKYGLLSYQWIFGDGSNSTDTHPRKKYSKDSTYTIRLVSSSEHFCRDTAYQTVTLHVSPKAGFSVNNDRQCFRGHRFDLINKSSVSKGNLSNFYWDLGDLNTRTSASIFGYTYTTEDSFEVMMAVKTDQNCYDTASGMLVTFAQPRAAFSIPNDSQCWQKHYFVIHNQTQLKYGQLSNFWQFGDNTVSNEFTPSSKQYPNRSASYTIRYKAVSEHGCSDSAQKTVVLLERPISNFTINDSIQCFRSHSFEFVNMTKFSAMNTLSYWWDYANGNTHQGIQPQTATYTSPGLYRMSLVSYSTLTNCYDTVYKTIIPAPHAQVAFNIDRDSQCFRYNQFNLSNQSQIQFGSMRYLWEFGDGKTDTAKHVSKSYALPQAYTIKLKVMSNYACMDSAELPIGFYATPQAAFAINDTAQCYNAHRFDFTNQSSIASGSLTQNWWFDDLSNGTSPDFLNKQFNSPEYHTVRLSVLSDKLCSDTLIRKVYLENHHNSRIDYSENDSQCLKGNYFDFSNTLLNPQVSFVSSRWIYGDGQEVNLAKPPAMRFNKPGNFNMQLITESANGCFDTTSSEIVIHPHPQSAFDVSPVCYPEPSVFENKSVISSGNITQYVWDFGDQSSGLGANPEHAYQAAGLYTVRLITESEYACKDTLTQTDIAEVYEKPIADFDFFQLPTIVQDQTRFKFNNLSSSHSSNYSWDFGNLTFSLEKDPIGLYQDTGRYWITLVAYSSKGCSDTIRKNTGLILPDFFFYLPNAFSPNDDIHNKIYRGLGTAFVYEYKMEIFNRWGQKLFETKDINAGWDGTFEGIPCMEGTYLVRVQIIPFKGTLQVLEQTFMLLR